MDIKLIEVPLSDRRLLRRFIDVPRYIHREHWPNPHWVPPLSLERKMFFDPAKHPVWRHLHARLWIANAGLRDVGRVSAVIDRDHLAHNDETCGFLGTFECPDDPALARLLCETAESWLVAQGMTKIIGPTAMNSIMGNVRLRQMTFIKPSSLTLFGLLDYEKMEAVRFGLAA